LGLLKKIRKILFLKFTSGRRWKSAIPKKIPPEKAFATPNSLWEFLHLLLFFI
jgi:hypothetical protein